MIVGIVTPTSPAKAAALLADKAPLGTPHLATDRVVDKQPARVERNVEFLVVDGFAATGARANVEDGDDRLRIERQDLGDFCWCATHGQGLAEPGYRRTELTAQQQLEVHTFEIAKRLLEKRAEALCSDEKFAEDIELVIDADLPIDPNNFFHRGVVPLPQVVAPWPAFACQCACDYMRVDRQVTRSGIPNRYLAIQPSG